MTHYLGGLGCERCGSRGSTLHIHMICITRGGVVRDEMGGCGIQVSLGFKCSFFLILFCGIRHGSLTSQEYLNSSKLGGLHYICICLSNHSYY